MTPAYSRRSFTKILGAGAAFAAVSPVSVISKPALRLVTNVSDGLVRLSSNENPYGPSPMALKAMQDAFSLAWRYPDEGEDALMNALVKLHGVDRSEILLGNGSGEVLKLAAATFTGAGKTLLVANPTFEAILRHAEAARAEVVKVDLRKDYAHDLQRMLASAANAGLVYICNPNNPTASLTPKEDIRSFLSKVPKQTIVLVDEAYHHYVDSTAYESVVPLVKRHVNLIVARTFSKIYGMAGLRCGYCVASAQLVQRMRQQQTWDSVNIMAMVAATASLNDNKQVEDGRRRNNEVRSYTQTELDKLSYRHIPSHANFLMVEVRREVRPVIQSLRARGVHVGRVFPPLPTFMRVTVGTKPQMETFIGAFREVMKT